MTAHPLEQIPTIRRKLGFTIVFAVGVTVLLIFLLLGYGAPGILAGHRPPHPVAGRSPNRSRHVEQPSSRHHGRAHLHHRRGA